MGIEGGDLGSLLVKIATDVSDLKKGLDDSQKKINDFSSKSSKAIDSLASTFKYVLGTLVVNEFKNAIESTIKFGAELETLSKIANTTASTFAELAYAVKQEGGSTETLARTLPILSKNASEAAKSGGDMRDAFRNLGVEVRDASGHLKSQTQIFVEIADGVSKSKNQTEALANAMKVLGRGSAELFPLLQKGGDGIRQLAKEFESFGFSGARLDQFAKDSKRLDDVFTSLQMKFRLAGAAIASALLPSIERLANKILALDLVKFADDLAIVTEGFLLLSEQVEKVVGWLGKGVSLLQQFSQVAGIGGFFQLGANASPAAGAGFHSSVFGGTATVQDPNAFNTANLLAPAVGPTQGGAVGASAAGPGGQSAGGLGGIGQGLSESAQALKDFQQQLEQMLTGSKEKIEDFKKGFKQFSTDINKTFIASIDSMFTSFGTAFSDMLFKGKDFSDSMKQGFKDMAGEFVKQVTIMIAKWLAFLALKLVLKFFGLSAGAFMGSMLGFREGGIFAREGAAMYARNGLLTADRGVVATGSLGEGGIPAVVHPNEIISPIDKFYDFMKQSQMSAAPLTVHIDGYNRDPRELAELVQIEADRKRRAP